MDKKAKGDTIFYLYQSLRAGPCFSNHARSLFFARAFKNLKMMLKSMFFNYAKGTEQLSSGKNFIFSFDL